jgi:hypothetical protein
MAVKFPLKIEFLDFSPTIDYIPICVFLTAHDVEDKRRSRHHLGARLVERREAQRPRGGLRNPTDVVTRAPRETDSQSALVAARGRTSRQGSS